MMDGTTLAEGSPDDIRKHAPPREDGATASLEDALPVHHGGTHEERRGRSMIASLKRIGALIVKELHQVVRDPGNVGIAVILPAVLLLLFGYGMSMDIKNVRIAYLAVPCLQPVHGAGNAAHPLQVLPDRARLLHPGGGRKAAHP